MLERKLDDVEDNSRGHIAMAAKLVLTHNYTYVQFISERLRNRLRTYEKICIKYRVIVLSLYTFD